MRRSLILIAAAGVVAAGLAVRQFVTGAPGELGGVVLYAVLVYCLASFALPRSAAVARFWVTGGVCWAVELFQLTPYPADLSAHNALWHLVLGEGFQWSDLACYAAGGILAVGTELACARAQDQRNARQVEATA